MLTPAQKMLLLITSIVFVTDIILSLCLCLVIPKHLVRQNEYARWDTNRTRLLSSCQKACSEEFDEPCITGFYDRDLVYYTYKYRDSEIYYMSEYEFVVAITEKAFSDSKILRFVCSGAVVTREWVITGEQCLRGMVNYTELYARVGSVKWHEKGNLYEVIEVSRPQSGIVALKVFPPLEVEPISIITDFSSIGDKVFESVGWESEDILTKEEVPFVTYWATKLVDENYKASFSTKRCEDLPMGRPVVLANSLLSLEICAAKKAASTFALFDDANWWEDVLDLYDVPVNTLSDKVYFKTPSITSKTKVQS